MSRLRQFHAPTASLTVAERTVYFLAALALIAAAAGLFVVLVLDVIMSDTGGVTQSVITVLERMLLLFILLELAHSVHIVRREQTLVAEPFLIIGLIAVVPRILIITAEAKRFPVGGQEFTNLILELAVLTALVIALAVALYFLRPHQLSEPGRGARGLLRAAVRAGSFRA
jgi:uncharacterized membrane protein (DUF373 family)